MLRKIVYKLFNCPSFGQKVMWLQTSNCVLIYLCVFEKGDIPFMMSFTSIFIFIQTFCKVNTSIVRQFFHFFRSFQVIQIAKEIAILSRVEKVYYPPKNVMLNYKNNFFDANDAKTKALFHMKKRMILMYWKTLLDLHYLCCHISSNVPILWRGWHCTLSVHEIGVQLSTLVKALPVNTAISQVSKRQRKRRARSQQRLFAAIFSFW